MNKRGIYMRVRVRLYIYVCIRYYVSVFGKEHVRYREHISYS
jgi:hypothetical protein